MKYWFIWVIYMIADVFLILSYIYNWLSAGEGMFLTVVLFVLWCKFAFISYPRNGGS